jgi:hypothetical protein
MVVNMKKILLIALMLVLFVLTACTKGDASRYRPNDVSSFSGSDKELTYTVADPKGLKLFDDYDVVTSLCSDACGEFVRAVKNSDTADFSPYIDNALLQSYMQYRVKNHVYKYSADSKYRYFITEVEFADDYALVEGNLATYSGNSVCMEGNVYFLVKNANGKAVINEWYWDSMDSPDVEYRGDFSINNNLDYWDNPSKYDAIVKQLSLTH